MPRYSHTGKSARISGVADHFAENDALALGIARRTPILRGTAMALTLSFGLLFLPGGFAFVFGVMLLAVGYAEPSGGVPFSAKKTGAALLSERNDYGP